jgi:hypothetical protein
MGWPMQAFFWLALGTFRGCREYLSTNCDVRNASLTIQCEDVAQGKCRPLSKFAGPNLYRRKS